MAGALYPFQPYHSLCLSPSLFFLSLLMATAPSLHHPLPANKEGPPRSIQPDAAFSVKHTGSGYGHHEREPREDEMEAQDAEDRAAAALSEEALDTIRKINPLTIADQVLQMFQAKADDRVQYRGLDDGGHANFAQEEREGARAPTYIRDRAPTIVHRPRTDDFGYSVMLGAQGPRPQQGEAPSHKEWRVPRPVDAQPSFPVYDEDISFIPDPFNGILDDNCGGPTSDSGQEEVRAGRLWMDSHLRGVRDTDLRPQLEGVIINTQAVKMK